MMIEGFFGGGGGFLFFLFKLSGPMYRNSPSLNLCETKVTLAIALPPGPDSREGRAL